MPWQGGAACREKSSGATQRITSSGLSSNFPGKNPDFNLPARLTDAIRYVEENRLRVRRRKV